LSQDNREGMWGKRGISTTESGVRESQDLMSRWQKAF